jgi:hypothetical protein
MPYVRTKSAGSFKLVAGFEPPSLDPVQSERVVQPLLEETNEFKTMQTISAEFSELEQKRQMLLADARRLRRPVDRESIGKAYKAVVIEQREAQERAAALKPALLAKHRELLETHGVRFYTPGVEEIDEETSEMLTSKFAGLGSDELLLIDGTVIKANEIKDQLEAERIAALTQEEKHAEKKRMLDEALTDSVIRRQKYEIQKRAEPLADAQQWYEAQCEKIEEKYA